MPSPLQIALAARDLNYSDLAHRVNRSPAWIAELAKGRRSPGAALAARIADELKVDANDLFGEPADVVVISFVRRSTASSGVPEQLEDPAVAEQVAAILNAGVR